MIDKQVETEIFIRNINEQTIKSFIKRYNGIDKQMDGSGFSFKFVDSSNIRCDKVNAPKDS